MRREWVLLAASAPLALGLLAAAGAAPPAAPAAKPDPGAVEFFEKNVRPVLAEHCYSCHGPDKQFAGLRLDTRAGALQGHEKGAVLVPGDPEKSRLIAAVRQTGAVKMPPSCKLPDQAVADLTTLLRQGP